MTLKKVFKYALIVAAVAVAAPVLFVAKTWLSDASKPLQFPAAGQDDASHMNASQAGERIAIEADPAKAEAQLVALLKRAKAEKRKIAIAGGHHSMGGHSLYPGGLVLDMDPFKSLKLDEEKLILTAGSGARWREIIPFLDARGLAVAVMQSNSDFSVGGSISVNCHGWQNDSPPIAGTVLGFRILTADGKVRHCSRTENKELFSLALGGYGLFGVILEVELKVVPNELYVAEAHRVKAEDYARLYKEWTRGRADVGMAYGRINVAPHGFMEEGIITLLKRPAGGVHVAKGSLQPEKPSLAKRLVFRSGVNSGFGKDLRWWLENARGETGGQLLSRNQIMDEASANYATRDPQSTDILQEYFIPAARFGEFIQKSKPVFLEHQPQLLNITVRNVMEDKDSVLRYATEEVFGLVLLYHQERTPEADAKMQALARDLIDVAHACGGRYYLPYRPHATQAQFLAAYPQAPAFFAQKKRFDAEGLFQNSFFKEYGLPLLGAGFGGEAQPRQR